MQDAPTQNCSVGHSRSGFDREAQPVWTSSVYMKSWLVSIVVAFAAVLVFSGFPLDFRPVDPTQSEIAPNLRGP